MRKYRFFYHYYRQYKCMSVHYRGECYKVADVICDVPTETKWNQRQPHLVIRGFASNLNIKDGMAFIS